MKQSEAAKLVSMLVLAYPAAKFSEENMDLYVARLCDLEFEWLQRAVLRLTGTSRFLPTIAEIRETATAIACGPLRSGADAWLDVVQQIRDEGYCGEPKFADPIVAEIVRRWGWVSLCKEGDDTADRARFIQMYDSLAQGHWRDVVSGVPVSRQLEASASFRKAFAAGQIPGIANSGGAK